MLQAWLCGKLAREQRNSEDLLTSAVFGLLSYLPPDQGLQPLLSLARFADDTGDPLFHQAGLTLVASEFWPNQFLPTTGYTEPDVLFSIRDPHGRQHLILIEVKLFAGKSGHPDLTVKEVRDQLAREWLVLCQRCATEGCEPHLVYLTSDMRFPSLEIQEAADELRSKASLVAPRHPFRCSWLSWTDIAEHLADFPHAALRDIAAVCKRLGLVHFTGFTAIIPMNLRWRFEAGQSAPPTNGGAQVAPPYELARSPFPLTWTFT